MRLGAAGFVLLLFAAGCASFSVGCGTDTPREILIVAKGMTLVLPSDPDTPNPVIRLRGGEHVKITLRNDAPGLMHNFEIPAWNVKTDLIRAGETTSVAFDVPATAGRTEYTCRPHAEMMKGFIEVGAQGD